MARTSRPAAKTDPGGPGQDLEILPGRPGGHRLQARYPSRAGSQRLPTLTDLLPQRGRICRVLSHRVENRSGGRNLSPRLTPEPGAHQGQKPLSRDHVTAGTWNSPEAGMPGHKTG